MIDESTFGLFRDFGSDLFLRGLISSHAGNLSIRHGDKVIITRKGSMLGRLAPEDLVEVDLHNPGPDLARASTEFIVHRAIYNCTDTKAVVHAHPPYSVLLSILFDEVIPVDSEGQYYFDKIPVVSAKERIGSEESASVVSAALQNFRIALLRGHGSFARGETLEEAYMITTSLEASAFYVYHLECGKEYKKFPDKYKSW